MEQKPGLSKKEDRKTIDAFELWCWRKLLGVTYLDKKRILR